MRRVILLMLLTLLPRLLAGAVNHVELPEVIVKSREKDVLHILGYMREYSTLSTYSDTIFLFREKTVDFMIPAPKIRNFNGWLRPRILTSRSYYRFTSSEGTDSVSDRFRQHFSWSDWVGLVDNIPLPEKLQKEVAANDTVFGKYSPAQIWRREDADLRLDLNLMADSLNVRWAPDLASYIYRHHEKVEFNEFRMSLFYRGIDNTRLMADNLESLRFDIETSGRARNYFRVFRKDEPYFVNTHVELYIVDREYLPLKLAKELEKNTTELSPIGIIESPEAPPLPPAIPKLMARVESIDHVERRLGTEVDHKLVGKYFDEMRYSHGILGFLYKHFGFRF